MIKVLYFLDRLRWGGIQSLCYDIICYIDKNNFQVEVLTLDDGIHYELEDTFQQMGITVHKLHGVWLNTVKDIPAYISSVNIFFYKHYDYHAIHINGTSKHAYIAYRARKVGIPVRIAHAHSTSYMSDNRVKRLIGNMLKSTLTANVTHLLACSQSAGHWLFGNDPRVEILKNGIKTSEFIYHEEWRRNLRDELNINDKYVIGCVGRLVPLKNHDFLIKIVAEMVKKCPDVCLLIVGEGECKSFLVDQIRSLGIEQNVIFLGFRQDRNKWLSAMDVFVLPSRFEGLGLAYIEAQCAGLPTFATEGAIPQEANISSLFHTISIKDSAKTWATYIIKNKNTQRLDMTDVIKKAGYDMEDVVGRLMEIYKSLH